MKRKSKKPDYADLFWLIGLFLGVVVTGVSLYYTKEAYCGMLCPLFGIAGLGIGSRMKRKNTGEQEEQRNARN